MQLLVVTCITDMYMYVIHTGVTFPRNFLTISKTILKRLFRVYAHIYHAHFDDVIELREEVCIPNAVAVYILCMCVIHTLEL